MITPSPLLIVCDAVGDGSEELGEPRFALLDRPPAEVLAIELEQVESAQHSGIIAQPITQSVKVRKAELVDHDGLAVKHA